FSGGERFALEGAARVAHPTSGEGKSVQHCEPVEPVIIGPCSDFELGRPSALQRSFEPGRQRATNLERDGFRRLLCQRAKTHAIRKRGFVQHLASSRSRELDLPPEKRLKIDGKVEQRLVASGPADERKPDGAACSHSRRHRDLRQAGVTGKASEAEGVCTEFRKGGAIGDVALGGQRRRRW